MSSFIDAHRRVKGLFGAGVVPEAEIDVPGHVDHMSRCRRQAGQNLRAVQRLLRVGATFDRVNGMRFAAEL